MALSKLVKAYTIVLCASLCYFDRIIHIIECLFKVLSTFLFAFCALATCMPCYDVVWHALHMKHKLYLTTEGITQQHPT